MQAESSDASEVLAVAGHQGEPLFDRGGRNQRIRKPNPGRPAQLAGPLGNQPADDELPEGAQQDVDPIDCR